MAFYALQWGMIYAPGFLVIVAPLPQYSGEVRLDFFPSRKKEELICLFENGTVIHETSF